MITVERKLLNWKLVNCYFAEEPIVGHTGWDIIGFSHSFLNRDSLQGIETLHIDLRNDRETLLADMKRKNRSHIRKAEKKGFIHVMNNDPSDEQLIRFRDFYNIFAKNKNTYRCRSFHLKTLKLLRDKGSLYLSSILNQEGETLCYQVYFSDGRHVLSVYSASHYRLENEQELKRSISDAARWLIWKNLLWFKESGHILYDAGGLTNDENIRNYKLEFGGRIWTSYSGYEAKSSAGRALLTLRKVLMAL